MRLCQWVGKEKFVQAEQQTKQRECLHILWLQQWRAVSKPHHTSMTQVSWLQKKIKIKTKTKTFPYIDHKPAKSTVQYWASQRKGGPLIIPSNYIIRYSNPPSLSMWHKSDCSDFAEEWSRTAWLDHLMVPQVNKLIIQLNHPASREGPGSWGGDNRRMYILFWKGYLFLQWFKIKAVNMA